jgi:hypothetical protein
MRQASLRYAQELAVIGMNGRQALAAFYRQDTIAPEGDPDISP